MKVGRQAARLLGGALFGALIGIALGVLGGDALAPIIPGPGSVLLALALYFVCILGHEAGHLAAGALAGFRPLLLIAGPLRLERRNGRTVASFNRSVPLAGGLAICTPVGIHDLRRRTMVMAAGGPLASLLLGVQCLLFWMALSSLGAAASVAGSALLLGGIISLAVGVLTLLPMRAGGFYSDGARIMRLMRNNEDTTREVALMALTAHSLSGTRPREWDADLVRCAAAIRDGGAFEVSGLAFAHLHALDSGDIAAARSYLEDTLARVHQLPAASRGPLQLGAAVFFALYDRDVTRARASLDAAGTRTGLLGAPHQRLLAEAAVRLAEGDIDGAVADAAAASALIERAAGPGSTDIDAAHARRILNAAVAAPGSPG